MICPMCKNPIYSNTSPDSEIFTGKTICEDCASNIHILLNDRNHAERQAALDYVQKQMDVTHDESIRSTLDTLIKTKPAPKPKSPETNQEDSEVRNEEGVREAANPADNKSFENAGEKIMKAAEVIRVLGIAVSIIGGLFLILDGWGNDSGITIVSGFIIAIGGSASFWVSSLLMYGFGELVNNSKVQTELLKKTVTDE